MDVQGDRHTTAVLAVRGELSVPTGQRLCCVGGEYLNYFITSLCIYMLA